MENFVDTIREKGRIVKSVSLTQEDDALITGLGISLSGILRQKIGEIRENSENFKNLLLAREAVIEKLNKKIEEQGSLLEQYEAGGK